MVGRASSPPAEHARASPAPQPADVDSAHSIQGARTLRFLVVDDVASNRRLLLHLLRRRFPGSTFDEAANGLEVVAAFARASEPAYDVVLMDGSMPVMDGMAATRELRHRFDAHRVLVLACTGNALAEE